MASAIAGVQKCSSRAITRMARILPPARGSARPAQAAV
jgi:hypothetical protein